jgi:hypothetical protein
MAEIFCVCWLVDIAGKLRVELREDRMAAFLDINVKAV